MTVNMTSLNDSRSRKSFISVFRRKPDIAFIYMITTDYLHCQRASLCIYKQNRVCCFFVFFFFNLWGYGWRLGCKTCVFNINASPTGYIVIILDAGNVRFTVQLCH